MLPVSLSVRGWRGPQAEGRQRGRGQRVTVSHVSPRGLLNVHPQPVDLPAGGGEVTLELELPLSQSEIQTMTPGNIVIHPSPPQLMEGET